MGVLENQNPLGGEVLYRNVVQVNPFKVALACFEPFRELLRFNPLYLLSEELFALIVGYVQGTVLRPLDGL
ncbi:hypothetical protein [Thermococcus sp. AM4]|uniref:hypothetical protein n=1 Tax=Thermococcus sp. (strain AM4) TaxID=246969 RepID=UPI000A011E1D|nr:hypothetical protein [Thermococcus sp. AM4]